MQTKVLMLALLATAGSSPVQGKRSADPIAPGFYCQIEPMSGFTGTGHDIALGDFVMSVEVVTPGILPGQPRSSSPNRCTRIKLVEPAVPGGEPATITTRSPLWKRSMDSIA